MYGLPDYKIAVNHGEDKIYFGELAKVNPHTDGNVDETDWLDVPSMVRFTLFDLLPEHPEYELVPCFEGTPPFTVAIKKRLRQLQLEHNATGANFEELKNLKDAIASISDAWKIAL